MSPSLPSWERGLKWLIHVGKIRLLVVAPLVGAWIEIICVFESVRKRTVAPLVGAWIEISGMIGTTQTHWVAPLVGAWIEIMRYRPSLAAFASLPSWERGLK